MDPFMLLTGGLSAASGIAGAFAQNSAAQYNYAADLLNYYSDEKRRRDTIRTAQEAKQDSQKGSTDSYGNRTYWDPQRGWVVDLAEDQQQLQDLQQNELMQVLKQDLPMRRAKLKGNNAAQQDERYMAEGLFDELRTALPEETDAVYDRIYGAKSRGINEGADNTLSQIYRKGLRTGASNTGDVVRSVNRDRLSALSDASVEAAMGAEDKRDADFSNKRAELGNLYNLFQTRASAMPDVSFAPQNISGQTGANLSRDASVGSGKDSAVLSAISMPGGTLNFREPNTALANGIGSLTAATSAFSRGAAEDKADAQNNLLLQYMMQGGKFDMANGGVLNNYLKNSGAF